MLSVSKGRQSMPTRKATSLDIAHQAGVSQATVSRALRDSPLVNVETRKRVQAIAAELNYQVDRSASSLRSGATRTIALLVFEDAPEDASPINPFFLNMLGSIARALSRRDYDLLVSLQRADEDWYARYEEANRADGLILLGYGDYGEAYPTLRKLVNDGARWVLWGPQLDMKGSLFVGCDNRLGGKRAAEYLLSNRRSSFAFIGNNAREQAPEFADRYLGFRETLTEAGVCSDHLLQVFAENSAASGARAMTSLVENGCVPDAIFCASDLIALGVVNVLMQSGFSVPDEVNVVGFDDIDAAARSKPALTTLRQDVVLAGEKLVSLLLSHIEGSPDESELLEPVLAVRET